MKNGRRETALTRRDLLKAGGGALAATVIGPQLGLRAAHSQAPKRGGTLSLRLWDPPHWDPYLTRLVQDPHRLLLHPQSAPQAQGRAGRPAGHLSDRRRSGRVLDPAERDDVHVQAEEGSPLAGQATGERPRAD